MRNKQIVNILKKSFIGIFLAIYIIVALLNYSLVQSFVGSWVSSYLSKELDAELHIGSMGINIFDHVVLRDVYLVDPKDDTVFSCGRLSVRFNELPPFNDNGINLDRVRIRDAYFFFEKTPDGNNLKFFTNYFKKKEPDEDTSTHDFVVNVNQLVLKNVRYKMRLKNYQNFSYNVGINPKNMEFYGINSTMRNIRVLRDNITLKMDNFSATEKGGFELKNLQGFVYVTPNGISMTEMDLETADSHLRGDVLLHFNGWKDMSDYVEKVKMVADFDEGSVGSLRDAAWWAPTLWPMEQQVNLSGLFYGPVADMHANDVDISFGINTSLHLDGYITGLTDIDNTIINATVSNFNTCIEDLRNVRHPDHSRKFYIPHKFAYLSPIHMDEVTFIGTINEFLASTELKTPAGNIVADAILQKDDKTGKYQYIGTMNSLSFNLKNLLPNEWVSRTGFDITIQGESFDLNDLQLTASGLLQNTYFNGEKIDFIELNADIANRNIDADLSIQDDAADLSISGIVDLSKAINEYTLTANIKTLNLSKLKLASSDPDSNVTLSSQISANAQGNSLDELVGTIVLSNSNLQTLSRNIHFDELSLLSREYDSYKNITFDCDLLHFTTRGYFSYSNFYSIAQTFCNKYLPDFHNPFFNSKVSVPKNDGIDLQFEISYSDSTNTTSDIIPGLCIAPKSTLSGSYNDVESLKFKFKSDSIKFGSFCFADIAINGNEVGETYKLNVKSKKLLLNQKGIIENISSNIFSQNAGISVALQWDDNGKGKTLGDIKMNMLCSNDSNNVNFLNSRFRISGEDWIVNNKHNIKYTHEAMNICNLLLNSDEQSIFVEGNISKDSLDYINIDFTKFDISQFNAIFDAIGLNMGGLINGNFSFHDLNKTPYYTAKLNVQDWTLNKRYMGQAEILSGWNSVKKSLGIRLTATIEDDTTSRVPVDVRGFYYPMKDDGSLDFVVDFDGFDLNSISPYLKSFSSQFGGNLHGNFAIKGTTSDPQILGTAFVDNGVIKIDMFNTIYKFSDSIKFISNQIQFNDFRITDQKSHSAFINGIVNHNHYKDFNLDLRLTADNMMIMNTNAKDNDDFYGTLLAKIDGSVKGYLNNLSIIANAQTNSGSSFYIPISDKQQISEQDFIRFTSKNSSTTQRRNTTATTGGNLRYNLILNISVTPDIKVYMPMDFSQMTANVVASGNGDLQLRMSTENDLTMLGNYNITSGSFKLDLMGLFSRVLSIEEGSLLSWSGKPTDASIDITGVYSQRISLTSLSGAEALEQSQHAVNVESVIALSGNLLNPTIKFDFRLPSADQSTEEEIYALIDRTNEREMVNQTVSLLAFHQFYSPDAETTTSFNTLSSGLGVAVNQVSSVVSNMVNFVDVNVDYKAGNELTTNQLDIDISKEWNRFYFETTFGFGGNARTMSQLDDGSASSIIGDILVGYKISPNFHVVAFNRSNANDYTKEDLPYTQGIGIKYSKDFNTWKSLFTRKKKNVARTRKKRK